MTNASVRRGFLFLLIIVTTLSWPSVAIAQEGDAGPTTHPSPQAAAPIYQARCANCHGPSGQGDGPEAVQANLSMPDLTDPALLRETTPARWFDIISSGVPDEAMPPFGDSSSNPLRRIDRWNLVFYLYTLGTPAAQVSMGQALYQGSCEDCHGTDGAGNSDGIPGFTALAEMANRSQSDLFDATADIATEGHELGLGDVEIWSLTDYVRTFSYNYAPPSAEASPSAPTAAAAINPLTGGPGVISGQLLNGSPGGTLPENQVVRLRAFDMNANFVDSITTTIDSDGSFRFVDLNPSVPAQYEPLIVYQEIPYFGDMDSAIVLSPDQPAADVNITIFETIDDASDIRIERLHIVLDFAPGQIQVAELYILSNDGQQTFVGTLEKGTLPIVAPAGALSFQPGGDPSRYIPLADGIADTIPIPPGQSTAESVVVYDLAYDGDLELSRQLPYDVSNLNVFVPGDAGIEVSGDGIRSGGPFQAQGSSLDTYVADNLAAGDSLTLRVSGEAQTSLGTVGPSPHQTSGPSQTQSTVIGLLALAVAVAFAFLYWQGRLNLRLRPAAQDGQAVLLQAIAGLDDDFEAGKVKEKTYQVKRAELKEELIGLMQTEEQHGTAENG